ncbi:hypothetical protein B0A55_02576 [Friedmanniomyces simplex]|uniref:Rhodopsin domain-containing protein n=1 Tax=Friedmanniomyces simplex TaxID=329884 RepID=A0A4U0XL68_9PEZI|nr:hypothetical protein B0A55_02576 [Friedmanniomyces simplex]
MLAGRFAARSTYFEGAGYGWDDWVILGVELLVTAIAVIAYIMIRAGLGRDMWMLEPENITSVLRYFWIEEMLYSWAVQFTKVSIVLFYLRIFSTSVSTRFRPICFKVIGLCIATATAFVLATAFQCSPVSYSWTLWDGQHEGHCFNTLAQIYAGSGINTALDLLVFVLPIPKLLQVQISTRKKAGVVMTFAVGIFVTTCSIIRLAYVIRWRKTTNPTWTYAPIALWSLIECDVGVICACMPALAGPIKRFWIMAVGQHLSNLYESRSKEKATKSTGSHARPSSNSWRSVSRPGDSKHGTNSIMRNVDLEVSDEVELVDKHSSQRNSRGGVVGIHDYRQKW